MARTVAVVVLLMLAASGSVATRVIPKQKQLEGPATATEAGERRYRPILRDTTTYCFHRVDCGQVLTLTAPLLFAAGV